MKSCKKLLSWLLVLCMTVGMLPSAAFAADGKTSAEAGVKIVQESYDSKTQIMTLKVQGMVPAGTEGLTSAGITMSYDSSKLALVDAYGDECTETGELFDTIEALMLGRSKNDRTAPYEVSVSYLFADPLGSRNGLFIALLPKNGTTPDFATQNTGNWFDIASVQFKVKGGNPTKNLDSTSIRIADPAKDAAVIEGTGNYGSKTMTVSLMTSKDAVDYQWGRTAAAGVQNDKEVVMAHADNCKATYDGSDNLPPKKAQAALTMTPVTGAKFGNTITLEATGGSIAGDITYAIVDGSTGAGTIEGNQLTITKAGIIKVQATMAGNDEYAEVKSEVMDINADKADQEALTVTSTSGTYGEVLTLTTKGGSSTGKVTYEIIADVSSTGAGSIDGDKLTVTKAGTIKVQATKAADDNYNEVKSAETEITIAKAIYGIQYTNGSAKYGNTGTVDLSSFLPEGVTAEVIDVVDSDGITTLDKTPEAYPSVDGKTLKFKLLNDANIVGKDSTITVKCTGDNYETYYIAVTVTAEDKPAQSDFKFAADTQTKTYGDGDFTVKADGAVNGSTVTYKSSDTDVATVNAETGKVTIVGAGTATITATASETAEYAKTEATYTLNVGQKTVTITAAANDKEYDGNTHATVKSAAVNGRIGEDDVKVKAGTGTAAFDNKNVGTAKTVTFKNFALDGADAGNYKLSDAVITSTAEITAKPVTITDLKAEDKTYDGKTDATVTGEAKISGMFGTDDVAVKPGTAAFDNKNVGTNKTVTFSDYELLGAHAGNYKLTAQPASVTANITAATPVYSVAATKTFRTGTAASAVIDSMKLPTTAQGVNGETVTGKLKWYSDSDHKTAVKDADLSGVLADASKTLYWVFTPDAGETNYKSEALTGSTMFTAKDKTTLTVDVSKVKVQDTDGKLVYNGEAVSYSGKPTTTETVTGWDYTWYKADDTKLAEAPKDAGSYYLLVSIADADPDYMGSAKVEFTIAPKTVTITGLGAEDKTYDGSTTATVTGTAAINGKVGKDVVTVKAGTAAFDNKNVGTNKTVTFTGFKLDGAAAGNYKLSDAAITSTAKITAKPVTITGLTAPDHPYDGTKNVTVSGGTLNGIVAEDEGKVSVNMPTTGTVENANVGNDKVVTIAKPDLTGEAKGNYELTTLNEVKVNIIKGTHDDVTYPDEVGIKYGAAETLDLTKYVVKGGTLTTVIVEGDHSVLNGTPAVNKNELTITIADDTAKIGETATVKVTVSSANYENYNIQISVKVLDKPAQKPLTITTTKGVYGTDLKLAVKGGSTRGEVTYAITGGTGEGTIVDGVLKVTKVGTFEIKAVMAGNENYADVETTATVTIEKATQKIKPTYDKITEEGKTLADANLAVEGGTIKWVDENGHELLGTTPVEKNKSYMWKYTPADTTNYNEVTGTITLYRVGGGGGSFVPTTYDVVIEPTVNGTVKADPTSASKGETVKLTIAPAKDYLLDKLVILDEDGKEIKAKAEGPVFVFEMPASDVTVKVTFKDKYQNPFTDVKDDDYFAEPVMWAVYKNITAGISEDKFGPDFPCTRAQIVTFLWNAAGKPEPAAKVNPFQDVTEDDWFYKSVLWAAETGITAGISDTEFGPDLTCTRAQAMTFLWKYVGKPADKAEMPFTDVTENDWFYESVQWAVANEITAGTSESTFGSGDDCTRAQIVTFLYRALKK